MSKFHHLERSSYLPPKRPKSRYFIFAFAGLALIGGAAVGLWYWNAHKDRALTEAEKEQKVLAQVPPPALIPESWLKQYFGTTDINDPKVGGYYGDPDGDHLNNYQEYLYGTDPTKKDTDGDGYNDGTEVAFGSDPLNRDVTAQQVTNEKKLRQAGVDINYPEIEREFNAYLSTDRKPSIAEIPDTRFKVVANTPETLQAYYTSFKAVTAFVDEPGTLRLADSLFENVPRQEIETFIARQSEVVKNMIALPVPDGLLAVHKMYLKNYQLILSMAEYARSELAGGKTPSSGSFYPELSAMLQLDPELKQLKLDAITKYHIPI